MAAEAVVADHRNHRPHCGQHGRVVVAAQGRPGAPLGWPEGRRRPRGAAAARRRECEALCSLPRLTADQRSFFCCRCRILSCAPTMRGQCQAACLPRQLAAWSRVGALPASGRLPSAPQPCAPAKCAPSACHCRASNQASGSAAATSCHDACRHLCTGYGRKSAEATGMMEGDRPFQASPARGGLPQVHWLAAAAAAAPAPRGQPTSTPQPLAGACGLFACTSILTSFHFHLLLYHLCCLQGIFPTKKITTALEGVLPAAQASPAGPGCSCCPAPRRSLVHAVHSWRS